MNIGDLPIPAHLIAQYHKDGIAELYPPQVDCVDAGLFDNKNLLIAIPTASGKTLVAEMAMHHHIARGGRALYIVPLKALAAEKYAEFNGKQASVGIATGDYDRRDESLGRNRIIIATSEKVDSLLRNEVRWLSSVSLLVVDEVHLIDEERRGPTLELVIAKLRSLNPGMQVIALSATIGNPDALAGWLEAVTVTSGWRPVVLREGIYWQGAIRFRDGERQVPVVTKSDDINLCLDTIAEGGQCLVFVSSRRNAESLARRIAKELDRTDRELQERSQRLRDIAETDMGRTLADCMEAGAAFHHAGLAKEQRNIVECAFREGAARVIAATPTLAAGLNLPARRVIIRDIFRFQAGLGMVLIPVREYRQMAGRAGRPRLDPYGEAVLIARGGADVDELAGTFIDAPAEDIHSRCDSETALRSQILSLISSRFVGDRAALETFMGRTFFAAENKNSKRLSRYLERVLAMLCGAEMIVCKEDCLTATPYGTLVSRLYLDPLSAESIRQTLPAHESFSDFGLLQLLCSTPDMFTLYARKTDIGMIEKYLIDHEEEVWVPYQWGDGEDYFRAVKTAMALLDWADEVGEATICDRYGIGPGDLHGIVEGIGWLLHAGVRLAAMVAPEHKEAILETGLRVRYGVRRELLPLVRLRGIGRVRARRLFNNGLTTPDAMRQAGHERLAPVLGAGIAAQVLAQIEGKNVPGPAAPLQKKVRTQVTLGDFQEEEDE